MLRVNRSCAAVAQVLSGGEVHSLPHWHAGARCEWAGKPCQVCTRGWVGAGASQSVHRQAYKSDGG